MSNRSYVWSGRFSKSIWLARQKHSEPVANVLALSRHVVIALFLSKTGFSTRKSRELVADTSEPVRNLSASGPDSINGLWSLGIIQ